MYPPRAPVQTPTAGCCVQVSYMYYMLQRLQMAFEEVLASQDLAMLLLAVVDLGNVLNAGSQRGGARGFKFDLLLRLPDTKSADKKSSTLKVVLEPLGATREVYLKTFLWKDLPGLNEPCSTQVRDFSALVQAVLHSDQLRASYKPRAG